jgi:hypothetical protein
MSGCASTSTFELSPEEESLAHVVDQYGNPSCVTFRFDGERWLTARHCVQGANQPVPSTVTLVLGGGETLEVTPELDGTYQDFDELLGSDLVVLRDGVEGSSSILSSARAPRVGDEWTYVRIDVRSGARVRRHGRIASVEPSYVSTTIALCPGDSGGPAFDGAGLLVGVASASASADCRTAGSLFTRTDVLRDLH